MHCVIKFAATSVAPRSMVSFGLRKVLRLRKCIPRNGFYGWLLLAAFGMTPAEIVIEDEKIFSQDSTKTPG